MDKNTKEWVDTFVKIINDSVEGYVGLDKKKLAIWVKFLGLVERPKK